jgi:hypothetical protein
MGAVVGETSYRAAPLQGERAFKSAAIVGHAANIRRMANHRNTDRRGAFDLHAGRSQPPADRREGPADPAPGCGAFL